MQESFNAVKQAEAAIQQHKYEKAAIFYGLAADKLKPFESVKGVSALYFHYRRNQNMFKRRRVPTKPVYKPLPKPIPDPANVEQEFDNIMAMESKIQHLPEQDAMKEDFCVVSHPYHDQIRALKEIIRKLAEENDRLKTIEKFEGATAFRQEFTAKFRGLRLAMQKFRRLLY